jgi:LPS-assembly protein
MGDSDHDVSCGRARPGAGARRVGPGNRLLLIGVAAGLLAAAGTGHVLAQGNGDASANTPSTRQAFEETPAVLQADEVEYQDDREVVVARGNVEISQGERILLADQVSYNLQTDVITAEGDVSLLQPTGEVAFADYVEVTGDLREGALRAFRMLLTDNSRLAAATAVRVGDNRTDMNKAVYSPCDLCADDPGRAPLWQMRAQRVTHDQEAQQLRYRNVSLELFGLPVFYTPYFEHPDPTAERQSGVLTPTIGFSTKLGANARVPYYFVLSDQSDLTLEPIVTTGAGQAMLGTYRRETPNGAYAVTGSIARADSLEPASPGNIDLRRRDEDVEAGDLRGHVNMRGRFDIDDYWRWGFDVDRASDDAYLRRYGLGYDETLRSDLYVERFEGRNYFVARGLSFQRLRRQDDQDEEPFVLPEARYAYVGEPDLWGGQLFGELATLNLMRSEGRDTQRISGTLGWETSYVESLGGRITFTAVSNLDLYAFQDTLDGTDRIDVSSGRSESGTAVRAFPQAALSYAYPLTRSTSLGSEVLEPRIQAVLGPNGGNDAGIPNETSRTFEFAASNLFQIDRLPGRDRVSSGQRIDYGIDYTYTTPRGAGTATARLGQSYRINSDSALPSSVGRDEGFSDIVGRVAVSPIRYLTTSYDFRADEKTLQVDRSEYGITIGPPAFEVSANHIYLADDEAVFANFGSREQLKLQLRSRVSQYWSVEARSRWDLEDDRALSGGLALSYQDECFLFRASVDQQNYDRTGVEDDTTVLLTIGLKNLGEFGSGGS